MLSPLRKSRLASTAKDLVRRGDDWLGGLRRAIWPGWKPRVLFQISNTLGYDAQEPVIRALVQRGHVTVHAAGGIEGGLSAGQIDELGLIGVPHRALGVARHWRFDAIIITGLPLAHYWRSSRRLYLHHGSGFVTRDPPYALELMLRGEFEYLLALHETEVARGRAIVGERLSGRAAVVGQPKLDKLLALSGSSREVLASLDLDPARKTVLVMSHWTPTSLMHSCGSEVLRFLETRPDVNVLVTGHHHLWDYPGTVPGSIDWRSRLSWVADVPHMRLLPLRDDVAALMAASDLAITDHTSATLEYATLYRPMVLYRNPAHPFTEPDIDEQLRRASSVFTAMSEFPAAFQEAVAGGGCDRVRRAELLDSCFRYLGKAAHRAAAVVEQVAWNGVFDDPDHSE